MFDKCRVQQSHTRVLFFRAELNQPRASGADRHRRQGFGHSSGNPRLPPALSHQTKTCFLPQGHANVLGLCSGLDWAGREVVSLRDRTGWGAL